MSRNVEQVRAAIRQLRDGAGSYADVRAAVEGAIFDRPRTVRSYEDLIDQWEYRPGDTFTDVVETARWRRVLTPEQVDELRNLTTVREGTKRDTDPANRAGSHAVPRPRRAASAGRPAITSSADCDAVAQDTELTKACRLWQSGKEIGSSLLRGGARVITGVPHYFSADFITAYEDEALANSDALRFAQALLDGVAKAEQRDAEGWNAATGLPLRGFAGRGPEAKPEHDPEILERLHSGSIDMPLWGVSLDREIAESYRKQSDGFLFEIVGPFPAVASWTHSGIKAEEQELVAGGRYVVESMEESACTTHVRLRWSGGLTSRR